LEQSTFWSILRNPKFHYRLHNRPPPAPIFASYQRTSPITRSCKVFRNTVNFYGEELFAARPATQLEDHPLSAIRDRFFSIFQVTLHIWRPFLLPQFEDAPFRGDKDLLIWDECKITSNLISVSFIYYFLITILFPRILLTKYWFFLKRILYIWLHRQKHTFKSKSAVRIKN